MIDYPTDFEIRFMQLTTTWITKNVNSKKLVNEIHKTIFGLVTEDPTVWLHDTTRTQTAWLIDEYLANVYDEGYITQHNVICDARNNTAADVEKRVFHLDISFIQKHCLNTTRINYVLELQEITY